MGDIILILFALILLAVTYLLFTPLRIQIDFRFGEKFSAGSTIAMFPFRYRIAMGKGEKPKRAKKETAEKPAVARKRFDYSRIDANDRKLLFKILGETFKFLGRLIKAPDSYFVRADLSGGAAEPDTTGMLFGAYQAVTPILPRSVTVAYNPDFLAERLEGTVECGLAVRIITVLMEMARFVFRLPKVKLYKLYRKLK